MNVEGHAYIALRLRGISPAAPDIGNEPPEWMMGALCSQYVPDTWFPEGKGGSTHEAKRICKSCDFTTECLEYALDNNEHFGVWGGLSERERRRVRSRRSVA